MLTKQHYSTRWKKGGSRYVWKDLHNVRHFFPGHQFGGEGQIMLCWVLLLTFHYQQRLLSSVTSVGGSSQRLKWAILLRKLFEAGMGEAREEPAVSVTLGGGKCHLMRNDKGSIVKKGWYYPTVGRKCTILLARKLLSPPIPILLKGRGKGKAWRYPIAPTAEWRDGDVEGGVIVTFTFLDSELMPFIE